MSGFFCTLFQTQVNNKTINKEGISKASNGRHCEGFAFAMTKIKF